MFQIGDYEPVGSNILYTYSYVLSILTAFVSDTAVSSSDGRTQQLFKRNDVDNNDINDINDNYREKNIKIYQK